MIVAGLRLLFRVIGLVLVGSTFLMFVSPGKLCREKEIDPLDFQPGRCLSYEFSNVRCPHVDIYKMEAGNSTLDRDVIVNRCPVRITELIVPTAIGGIFSFVFLIDIILAKQLMTHYDWPEKRQRMAYLILVVLTIATWLSVLVTLIIAYVVRWPKVLKEAAGPRGERIPGFEKKKPPITWIAAMICSAGTVCLSSIELAVLLRYAKKYM